MYNVVSVTLMRQGLDGQLNPLKCRKIHTTRDTSYLPGARWWQTEEMGAIMMQVSDGVWKHYECISARFWNNRHICPSLPIAIRNNTITCNHRWNYKSSFSNRVGQCLCAQCLHGITRQGGLRLLRGLSLFLISYLPSIGRSKRTECVQLKLEFPRNVHK